MIHAEDRAPVPSPSLMKPSQGILLIADITGYIMYLQGSELEHAHGVLTDLLAVLVEGTRPPLAVSNLRADAVFSYGAWLVSPGCGITTEPPDSTAPPLTARYEGCELVYQHGALKVRLPDPEVIFVMKLYCADPQAPGGSRFSVIVVRLQEC